MSPVVTAEYGAGCRLPVVPDTAPTYTTKSVNAQAALCMAALPSTDERHLGGHHRKKLNVGVKRQRRHEQHGIDDVRHVHTRLGQDLAAGLKCPGGEARRHIG